MKTQQRISSVHTVTHYYPFGMLMPNRQYSATSIDAYRFGFNGKEEDNQVSGTGNSYDLGARMYDSRIGRTSSVDPKQNLYPQVSPFAFSLNNPTNAIDPDGKVVIFINGNHFGDGGSSNYWRQYSDLVVADRQATQWYDPGAYHYEKHEDYAFDKAVMQQFGDYKARYYDGGLGGYAPINLNSSGQTYERYMSGYQQAKSDAGDIIANLQRDADGNIIETIKVVSHSMGGVYSKGFVKGLQEYISDNKINGVKIEIEVDFAPYQPSDPLNAAIDGVLTYQASHSNDPVAGKKPGVGAKQLDTSSDQEQGHSIFNFKSTVKKIGALLKDNK